MRVLDLFKKSIDKERVVFPQVIEDSEMIQRLDRAVFDNKSPYVISFIFRLAAKDTDVTETQTLVNEWLKEKREVSADDTELINNIVSAYGESKEGYWIFGSVGNLIYLSEVLDEIKDNKQLSKTIMITCFLWLYQNIVETIYWHLSEVFYVIAKHRNDREFIKEYHKLDEGEEHFTAGKLLRYAKGKSFNLTSEDKHSFLHHSELRNRLAHANCFYDSKREEIILSSKKKLTFEEFEKEFKYVKDFLFELIYLLNNKQVFVFKQELITMARQFQRIGRSSPQKKALQQLDLLR